MRHQATEAATQASQMTATQILAGQKEATSSNPMGAMMVRTMEPLLQSFIGKLMKQVVPGIPIQQEEVPRVDYFPGLGKSFSEVLGLRSYGILTPRIATLRI